MFYIGAAPLFEKETKLDIGGPSFWMLLVLVVLGLLAIPVWHRMAERRRLQRKDREIEALKRRAARAQAAPPIKRSGEPVNIPPPRQR